MKTYWGIDLGGTKIEGVVLSAPSPDDVIIRKRIDTEAHKGYQHILSQICKLIQLLKDETKLQPDRIGFCTPGAFDRETRTMKNSNMTCINGKPFNDDLFEMLNVPIITTNDANCFTLSEVTMGIVKNVIPDYRMAFGLMMGTGVGGGIVFRGNDDQPVAYMGRQGISGEFGHNVLEENGYECYCGKKGCVERVISGPALEKFYFEKSKKNYALKTIIERHHLGGDKNASITVERLLENFGKAVSVVINILDPDVILLGGGVSNVDLLYTEGVERVKKYVFNNGRLNTLFLKPKLGDSAGVFGAAIL